MSHGQPPSYAGIPITVMSPAEKQKMRDITAQILEREKDKVSGPNRVFLIINILRDETVNYLIDVERPSIAYGGVDPQDVTPNVSTIADLMWRNYGAGRTIPVLVKHEDTRKKDLLYIAPLPWAVGPYCRFCGFADPPDDHAC